MALVIEADEGRTALARQNSSSATALVPVMSDLNPPMKMTPGVLPSVRR